MSKTFATKPFDTYSTEKDSVVLHNFSTKLDVLSYKRTAPKRVKDFPGMEKSEMKHTLVDATGQVLGIFTVSTSIKADVATAVRDTMKSVVVAAMADATFDSLYRDQRLPVVV